MGLWSSSVDRLGLPSKSKLLMVLGLMWALPSAVRAQPHPISITCVLQNDATAWRSCTGWAGSGGTRAVTLANLSSE
jgi:hypothetical protein